MEHDPDDIPPERPALNGTEREELRARIRSLLASRSVADRVRANLTARLPQTDDLFDVDDQGLDGMLDGLPLSLRRFLRGPEGSLGSFIGHHRPSREDRICSRT
jgi:hypothetical protein